MTAWSTAAFETLSPRPRLTVSEWADAHRVIPRGTSPEAGPWRTDRVPYLREPMDAISDPTIERVICQWGSQLGKTDGLLLNAIGYYAHQDPSSILLVQPTEIAAQSFSKERLEPTFRESPSLRGKLSESLRDRKNTILLKQFPGGYLACAWATSAVSLASRPIRVVLADEIDRWPDSTGRDGDPWSQAVQRTSNFHDRKIVAVSTPTIEGISAIVRLYEETDQRRLWVPCPRCGAFQVLRWAGVRYKSDSGLVDLSDTHYRCEHCSGRIEEHDRPAMLAECQWQPENPGNPNRGYQLSALYSPWVKWRDLAAEWVKASSARDKRGLQEFVNLRLGEPWTDGGDAIAPDALEKNREHYEADLPDGVVLLTAGADVQDDRIEVEVVGWGAGKQSWGIQYAIFQGDTSRPDVWADLSSFLGRHWLLASGAALSLWRSCVDSGGHRADEVYEFCRPRAPRVAAIKGRGGPGIPITTGKPTIVGQMRAMLYIVGSDAGKDAVYSRLMIAEPGPGYCHFPVEQRMGYDAEYFRGLCSEKRKPKMRAGRRVYEWVQVYRRNEPLDCRNYATAAMELAVIVDGIDLDTLKPPDAPVTSPSGGPVNTPPAPRRRVLSKGVG